MKKHLKKLAVILPALMILAVPSNVFASEVEQHEDEEEHVDFAAQAEFIRGHLMQAVANKEANKIDLAKAHAGHPVAEHFAAMESEIMKHNKAIHDELQAALDQLPGKAETLSSTDFKKEASRIDVLLENALIASVPPSMRDDSTFWIKVAIKLLETTEHEYEEGVSEGEVKEMIEYQDAQGFTARAESIFKNIGSKINDHSREELEKFFADLNSAINSAQDPDKIETFIDAIVNELREVAGIEETEKEITSQQYIENARQLLKQVSVEYKNGNFTGADKLAVFAYLENFEYVESDLAKNGAEDLMGQIEQMMRVELRDMIKNKVTQDKLDSQIDAIDAKLKEAYVVVPEFPVGLTVALASIVGAVVALTRIKGHVLRMP